MALDGDHDPVDALASNMAHCLWTGIVDAGRAPTIARHLLSPEMFSGWGLRTLASSSPAYNPVSYHCGSVWPHDTAIAAAGLMRYGLVEEAHRLIRRSAGPGVAEEGRLPELVAGFSRHEFPLPVPYPTSCSPQAWSAASPLLLLRTLLRFDPAVPLGKLFVDPVLPGGDRTPPRGGGPPGGWSHQHRRRRRDVEIGGVPEGIEVVRGVRPDGDLVIGSGRTLYAPFWHDD